MPIPVAVLRMNLVSQTMAHAFFLGVDGTPSEEGSQSDVTITIVEKSKEPADGEASFRLDHINHRSEVSSADEFADYLQGLVADQPYLGRINIIVNRSEEFGQNVIDALEDRGLAPVAATLTSGTGATAGDPDEVGVHLGVSDAVRTMVNLYRDERFAIEGHTTETASRLAREVQNIAEDLDEADGDEVALGTSNSAPSFDALGPHLTSAALATWLGRERSFDPSKHLKEDPQTQSPSADQPGV